MNAPLSRFLVEFSREKVVAPVVVAIEPIEIDEPEPVEIEPVVTLSPAALEQRLDEAREQAASAERMRVEADLAARFEAEKAEMQATFDAARESWATGQGQQISDSLTSAIADLETRLSSALAQALQPLFMEACRSRMLDELGLALSTILGDPSHPPVRIQGPADLLTAFGTAHASGLAIDYVVDEAAAELAIVTDATRIETRLSACLEIFRQDPRAPVGPEPAAAGDPESE